MSYARITGIHSQIQFQVSQLQPNGLIAAHSSQARPNPCQEFREGKGLHKVVVSTAIQTLHAVVDGVAGREDENRCVQSAFSKCGQHLKTITAGKHQIQDHEVEFLGINKKEAFFARRGNDDLVSLALQPLTKGACDFRFVFNDKNPQWKPFLPASYAAIRRVAT